MQTLYCVQLCTRIPTHEIMPLRITMVFDTLCHSDICHSEKSRMSGPLYTRGNWNFKWFGLLQCLEISFVTTLHTEGAYWQGHSQFYLDLHFTFICHNVQRSAHSSLVMVADATVGKRRHMPLIPRMAYPCDINTIHIVTRPANLVMIIV